MPTLLCSTHTHLLSLCIGSRREPFLLFLLLARGRKRGLKRRSRRVQCLLNFSPKTNASRVCVCACNPQGAVCASCSKLRSFHRSVYVCLSSILGNYDHRLQEIIQLDLCFEHEWTRTKNHSLEFAKRGSYKRGC